LFTFVVARRRSGRSSVTADDLLNRVRLARDLIARDSDRPRGRARRCMECSSPASARLLRGAARSSYRMPACRIADGGAVRPVHQLLVESCDV
jgi:hypothetical protein